MNKRNSVSSYTALETLGRVQLSDHYFMRDFLYSEISNYYGIPNYPENPKLAIAAGKKLCQALIEPLHDMFGHVTIRSGYRSPTLNQAGNDKGHNCATNERNFGHHIWDRYDKNGHMGATACVVIPWFVKNYEAKDWQKLAWWIHDHLPYSSLYFFPKLCAFNLRWCESPARTIKSFISPKGILTKPGMDNFEGSHESIYQDMLQKRKDSSLSKKLKKSSSPL